MKGSYLTVITSILLLGSVRLSAEPEVQSPSQLAYTSSNLYDKTSPSTEEENTLEQKAKEGQKTPQKTVIPLDKNAPLVPFEEESDQGVLPGQTLPQGVSQVNIFYPPFYPYNPYQAAPGEEQNYYPPNYYPPDMYPAYYPNYYPDYYPDYWWYDYSNGYPFSYNYPNAFFDRQFLFPYHRRLERGRQFRTGAFHGGMQPHFMQHGMRTGVGGMHGGGHVGGGHAGGGGRSGGGHH